ncbi:hypothetical protein N0V90_010875 [Kalmusia sp. IMI 367209]|nr:hypothetical protein N0V90_010875 [Kalmusia sp. IMI 367209]
MNESVLSEIEAARQAAAYDSEPGSTTTVSSKHASDSEYDVDCIYAQDIFYEDGNDVVKYLVKWSNYPRYRCEWLPQSHLTRETFDRWQNYRKSLNQKELRELSGKHVAEVEEAKKTADEKKQRRRQKREELRNASVRGSRPPARKDNDHDRPTSRNRMSTIKHLSARTKSNRNLHIASSTQSKGRSVASSDNLSSLFVEETKRRRRGPIVQSSSEEDEPSCPSSEDEYEIGKQAKGNNKRQYRLSSPQPRRKSSTTVPLVRHSDQARRTSTFTRGTITDRASNAAPAPIKLVNEPKQPLKKVWNTGNKQFNTLKYRGIVEKRAQTERAPDPTALKYVNDTPPNIIKRPAEASSRTNGKDNTYARPESDQRHLQTSGLDDDPFPLQSYEIGKIRLMCYDYKYQTCSYTHEECRFLHREKDQLGRPLKVSHPSGQVPPKYRTPPETCWFWLRNANGCDKSPDDCDYAHENTGSLLVPIERTNWKVERIDPNERPRVDIEEGMVATGKRHPDTTCWYWLKSPKGCTKSDEECDYAHRNTGKLANSEGRTFESIDITEEPIVDLVPRRASLLHTNVSKKPPRRWHEMTCFFWNEGSCRLSEDACRSLHRYTGVVVPAPRNWIYPPGWQPRLRGQPEEQTTLPSEDEPMMMMDETSHQMSLDKEGNVIPRVADRTDCRLVSSPSKDAECATMRVEEGTRNDNDSHQAATTTSKDEEQPTTPMAAVPIIQMKRTIEKVLKLDIEEMFRCNGGHDGDSIAERRAFLMYDPGEHMEENELITRWLIMHHVEVFSLWFDGAWDAFKQRIIDGGTGIIITHPEFERYAEVPGFGDVLRGKVRLWSVGMQEGAGFSIWDPNCSQDLHYGRFEIFPHGGVIYITDDVFEKKPQLALKIVELFISKVEAGRKVDSHVVPGMYIDDGLLLWRLGVRPELMKWIGDTCLEHAAEIAAGDPDHASREKLYLILNDSGYIEADGTDNRPLDSRRIDFFPIISERQALAEQIGLYYKARERSQHEANTEMIDHFSALVIMERRNYRQYFVVHPEPGDVDWKASITNIDEIMTPEKCIEYFEADSKGNRFDNFEWAFED